MTRALSLLLPYLLGALLLGCGVGNRLAAPRADYALYRETRVGKTPAQRLGAGSRYLRELPEGRFRAEVRAWFEAAEPRFVAAAHDRPSLLRAYLRELPNGPHAQQVRDRLEEFRLMNEYRGRKAAERERFVQRVESELAAAKAGRQQLIEQVKRVVSAMSATRSIGQAPSALEAALLEGFPLEAGESACSDTLCERSVEIEYAVPTRSGLVARAARLSLAIELEAGAVKRIRVGGPDLFTRLGEAVDRVAIESDNLLGRTEAIARAQRLIEIALEPALPSGECRRDVVAPVVLTRTCRGLSLAAVVATQPGEVDRIEVVAEKK